MKRMSSADYLFWATRQRTGSPLRNLILMQLCNRAGKNGSCFPSHSTIARDCECTARAVRKHVEILEKDGYISVKRRGVDGMKTSSLYTFPIAKPDRNEVPNDRNMVPMVRNEVPNGTERGSVGVRNEVPIETPIIKHPIKHPIKHTHIVPCSPPEESDFDRFYEAYPKKVKRAEAEKAWKKLNPAHSLINRIMQDIKDRVSQGHWCTGKNKGFMPGPAPYLNGKLWTDEIIPRPEFEPSPEQLADKTQRMINEMNEEGSWSL